MGHIKKYFFKSIDENITSGAILLSSILIGYYSLEQLYPNCSPVEWRFIQLSSILPWSPGINFMKKFKDVQLKKQFAKEVILKWRHAILDKFWTLIQFECFPPVNMMSSQDNWPLNSYPLWLLLSVPSLGSIKITRDT